MIIQNKSTAWRQMTVGQFAPFSYGKSLPETRRNTSGNVPVIGSNGIVGYHDSALTTGPTVVIGRKGTVGAVHYSPTPCWPIDTTFYVAGTDVALVRFMYYTLGVLGLERMNTDSAVPGLNRNAAHERELRIPEESMQRAIAHVLGTLDDKIELNRRMNETLQETSWALFKSWFVDFDPVKAKATLRNNREQWSYWTIDRARAYLDAMEASIVNLFPDRLVESELGEIPEEWDVKRLSECFNLTMGQSPPGHTYNEIGKGLPFFQGNADFEFRYPKRRRYCSEPIRIAFPDDTLVSVRAPVGAINMAWEECCIGRGVAALRHISGSASFTYYAARALQNEIKQYEHTGTVFGAINKTQFEHLKLIHPTGELIETFEKRIRALDDRIRSNDSNSSSLSNQRDALLPRLVRGEIVV